MLKLFILSFFLSTYMFWWTFAWKWKLFLMVVAFLPLLTHSPSFTVLRARRLSSSVGFFALWLLVGLCQWQAQAGDLEWGDGFLSSSLPVRLLYMAVALPWAAAPVWQLSSYALSSFWHVLILHQVTAPQHFKAPGSAPSIGCFS